MVMGWSTSHGGGGGGGIVVVVGRGHVRLLTYPPSVLSFVQGRGGCCRLSQFVLAAVSTVRRDEKG